MTAVYPFTAIVGLEELKLALLLNAVSPQIGGVLVRGEKGTAKSTVVRALAGLLPEVDVVAGCRFACDPQDPDPDCLDGPHEPGSPARRRPARLVELPVGASEDRVVGALDLERALTEGVKSFEPGLLAAAHRGVLYVDEVNLLHDHLVDLLLDAAAMGTCYVEREGVSVRHASRFLLVGTMNPEEGELRPQLLDRFGLAVDVRASRDLDERAEVVRRRLAYEADGAAYAAAYADADSRLAERISSARARLAQVSLPEAALRQITAACAALEVDGLRADLVSARTALALAAWQNDPAVSLEHVRVAVALAVPHRRRRDPFDQPGVAEEELERALQQAVDRASPQPDDPGPDDPGPDDPGPDDPGPDDPGPDDDGPGNRRPEPSPAQDAASPRRSERQAPAGGDAVAGPGQSFRTKLLAPRTVGEDGPAGRRGRTSSGSGRTLRASLLERRLHQLHLAATLAAAA
ncbi:MAG: ATP-binding protein, partial [Mycobacteriales bacterium]